MPQGDKDQYTAKQKRKAKYIADNYCKLGDSVEKAKERAWRTVNPQDGDGLKRSGSGNRGGKNRLSRAFMDSRKREDALAVLKRSTTPVGDTTDRRPGDRHQRRIGLVEGIADRHATNPTDF